MLAVVLHLSAQPFIFLKSERLYKKWWRCLLKLALLGIPIFIRPHATKKPKWSPHLPALNHLSSTCTKERLLSSFCGQACSFLQVNHNLEKFGNEGINERESLHPASLVMHCIFFIGSQFSFVICQKLLCFNRETLMTDRITAFSPYCTCFVCTGPNVSIGCGRS